METLDQARSTSRIRLSAWKAEEFMTPNPMSIYQGATVSEAAAFLAGKGISAAPVIDEAGRPVGVMSSTDILIHMGQVAIHPVFCDGGPQTKATPQSTVRDVMTPGVFCVRPETPAAKLVEKMLALQVRRLFVVDSDGVLIGVISTLDVLSKLRLTGSHDG